MTHRGIAPVSGAALAGGRGSGDALVCAGDSSRGVPVRTDEASSGGGMSGAGASSRDEASSDVLVCAGGPPAGARPSGASGAASNDPSTGTAAGPAGASPDGGVDRISVSLPIAVMLLPWSQSHRFDPFHPFYVLVAVGPG